MIRFRLLRRRRASTRRRDQRGVASVELAMLMPILAILVFGAIDAGEAWSRSTSASGALRSAGVRAFDAGDHRQHDQRTLRALLAELNNRDIENVTKVVIYDAEGLSAPPASCLGDAALTNGGVLGLCNVYDTTDIARVLAGTDDAFFDDPNCGGGDMDRQWCPTTRAAAKNSVDIAGEWWVGIYFESTQDALVGVMPFFRTFELNDGVILKEWERT